MGLTPFRTSAYLSIAIPVVVVAVVALAPVGPAAATRPGWPWRQAVPWLALFVAAVVLEVAGLAIGGRSQTLPTLSDVVDHLLRWHAERFVLFAGWLALGVLIARAARRP
jgi:hypothetical protein